MPDLKQVRIDKLDLLDQLSWSEDANETNTSVEDIVAHCSGVENLDSNENLDFIGRIHAKRGSGRILFLDVYQDGSKIQVFLEKNSLNDYDTLKKVVDTGDVIWVSGSPFRTAAGELTIKANQCRVISKCLLPIPFGKIKDDEHFSSLEDVEEQQRKRHLHLMVNPEEMETFRARSVIIRALRTFMEQEDFLEVETPVLQPLRGGAIAKPFATHHNALEQDMFLRIAPELYLKRLLVAGFNRVYEIGKNFRNEGIDTTHNPEFTMLEGYSIGMDYQQGMLLVESLLCYVSSQSSDNAFDPEKPFKRIKFFDALTGIGLPPDALPEESKQFAKRHGLDVDGCHYAQVLDQIFKKLVVRKTDEPTFFFDYPAETSPLAKQKTDDPLLVERFQFVWKRMELVNGYSEQNDPFLQRKAFEEQAKNSMAGDQEAMPIDEDYIEALEYGMPCACGFGIGVDRLCQLLLEKDNIRDVILFPTLRNNIRGEA